MPSGGCGHQPHTLAHRYELVRTQGHNPKQPHETMEKQMLRTKQKQHLATRKSCRCFHWNQLQHCADGGSVGWLPALLQAGAYVACHPGFCSTAAWQAWALMERVVRTHTQGISPALVGACMRGVHMKANNMFTPQKPLQQAAAAHTSMPAGRRSLLSIVQFPLRVRSTFKLDPPRSY